MTIIEREGRAEFLAQRRRTWRQDVVSTLVTIAAAVAFGLLIVALTGKDPRAAFDALLNGPVDRPSRIGRWIEDTTTLTLLGLSVAIPFRAGQISIGAEGQLYLGALGGALTAIYVPLPTVLAAVVASIVAMLLGGLLGAIPGLMKSRLGANEIVGTLMLNVIIVQFFDYLVDRLKSPTSIAPVSADVRDAARWPRLSDLTGIPLGRANLGFLVAMVASVAVWLLISHTTLGYRMRVVGSNPEFAQYGGIRVPPVVDWSFILGGALAGLAGAHLVLGVYGRLEPGMAGGLAFLGIVVSLLARNNPLAILPAAAFYSYLRVGGDVMEQQSDVASELVVIIQATIVLLITARALPGLWQRFTRLRSTR